MNLATFFSSKGGYIFTRLLATSKNSIKIKIMSREKVFVILLTSAVICKQRLLQWKLD